MVELLADLRSRDRERIAARMGRSFEFVVEATDVALDPMSPRRAARSLVNGLGEPFVGYRPLVRGSRIRCERGVTPEKLFPGSTFLNARYDRAVLTAGRGPNGDEEAFVFLARRSNGTFYWRGIVYSLAGFRS